MPSFSNRRPSLYFCFTAFFLTGIAVGFIGREHAISSERLFYQSSQLTKIARDAMLNRATLERVVAKVETEMETSVAFSRGDASQTGVVVLPAETGFFGLGGRWILHLKTGEDGRCDQVWMEMQPVGWP